MFNLELETYMDGNNLQESAMLLRFTQICKYLEDLCEISMHKNIILILQI